MARHETVHYTCDICDEKCDPVRRLSHNMEGRKIDIHFVVGQKPGPEWMPDLCRKCAANFLTEILEELGKG